MEKDKILKIIINNRNIIINELKQTIIDNKFNYKTFGTEIEDYLFDIIINILKKNKLINNNNQYKRAKDKNEFPDLTILSEPILALEAKSGNRSKLQKGVWKSCKNSANDMGTINSWGDKIKKFGGENIYYVFIEYNFTDCVKEIVDVKIEPFYKFIGINSDDLLSYREKDGNLRPKDFDEESPIGSLEDFETLFPKTKIYRAKRLVSKHLKDLNDDEVNEILKSRKNNKK
jgi:hypothetical protein